MFGLTATPGSGKMEIAAVRGRAFLEEFWKRIRETAASGEGIGAKDALAALSLPQPDLWRLLDLTEGVRRRCTGGGGGARAAQPRGGGTGGKRHRADPVRGGDRDVREPRDPVGRGCVLPSFAGASVVAPQPRDAPKLLSLDVHDSRIPGGRPCGPGGEGGRGGGLLQGDLRDRREGPGPRRAGHDPSGAFRGLHPG